MSGDKKTAMERLKEFRNVGIVKVDGGISTKSFYLLVCDTIIKLADDLKEQKWVFDEHARIEKNFRQNMRIRVPMPNTPPAKPEPNTKWPEIVISQMATANFHSLSIRVKGEWPITIATFNSQYLKYFEAMAASYHERFGIIELTSSENIDAMLNPHGHDQEGGG